MKNLMPFFLFAPTNSFILVKRWDQSESCTPAVLMSVNTRDLTPSILIISREEKRRRREKGFIIGTGMILEYSFWTTVFIHQITISVLASLGQNQVLLKAERWIMGQSWILGISYFICTFVLCTCYVYTGINIMQLWFRNPLFTATVSYKEQFGIV